MVLAHLPSLKLNKTDLKILYTISDDLCSTTLGLTFKENPTNYPIIFGVIYKKDKYCSNLSLKQYTILNKYNSTQHLLGIQQFKSNFKYKYEIKLDDDSIQSEEFEYYNFIYYFNIYGFCNLYNFIKFNINFNTINNIKPYINTIIDQILTINKETKYIHFNLDMNNVMINNSYSIYLYNVCEQILKNYNQKEDKNKLLKEIEKYLSKKSRNEKLKNNNILGDFNYKYNKIIFINWDNCINIEDIIKREIKKYNINDKDIQSIIKLIYDIVIYSDIIFLLKDIIETLYDIKCLNTYSDKIYNDLTDLIMYIENKFEAIIKYIIKENILLKELNDYYKAYYVISTIQYMIYTLDKEKTFDDIFNYIYMKKYKDDKSYIHYNIGYICYNRDNYLKYNKIKLNNKDKKIIYKKV